MVSSPVATSVLTVSSVGAATGPARVSWASGWGVGTGDVAEQWADDGSLPHQHLGGVGQRRCRVGGGVPATEDLELELAGDRRGQPVGDVVGDRDRGVGGDDRCAVVINPPLVQVTWPADTVASVTARGSDSPSRQSPRI